MEILVMVGQLLLALTILVGVHEAGHMLTAKYFGMKVEKFSIGFPPKLFGFKKGETEYSMGAIPLGGFVKIAGMVDESLDTKMLSQEPQPYEFRAKPAWQRLIVMMGGILVNIITGIMIFIALIYIYGMTYIPMAEVNKLGIEALPLGKKIGLVTGDKILSINGKPVEKFPGDILNPDVLLSTDSYILVDRNGEQKRVNLPNSFVSDFSKNRDQFIRPIFHYKVEKVADGMGAAKAGVVNGDSIISVNGKAVPYFHVLQETLKENKGKTVDLELYRTGKPMNLKVQVDTSGKIGFMPKEFLKSSTEYYSFGQSIVKGPEMGFSVIVNTIKGFGKIFRREVSASDSLSGPIGIAKEFGTVWDWQHFWQMVGLLSMVLAFMNFLPIPALDGGHVMFLTYEIITRRKPSDKFMEVSQKIGMVLLLSLMAFAIGNDIFKSFK